MILINKSKGDLKTKLVDFLLRINRITIGKNRPIETSNKAAKVITLTLTLFN